MDSTVGIPATKMLDTFKSIPTWLFFGLSISLLLIWLWPPFLTALPESLRSNIPVALLFVATLTICKLFSLWFANVADRRQRSRALDLERLIYLYRPLNALFLTRHITVCTGEASPYLRQRLENAWDELGSHGRRSRRLKRAWHALFDKQRSLSFEVEYGGGFPLAKIIDLVRTDVRYAGPELQDLINRADRSQYEEYDRALMTNAEYALFEHIDREHRRLSARVG
ncbi:hypothetical protein KQX62_11340 [Rhodopseudomonas palustris]|uniref:DUF4129 domain-containing protein n=1 Tax=Rhodopseudomonas palustris TaxID=1076 RepID=A0AAX3E4B8_RHOPL|nr:hypothetical protein [Rhodopseudomonas palustris]UYO41843.1 hypothetical protein KQX62_11340 [Rhodopseudomonas palustris]